MTNPPSPAPIQAEPALLPAYMVGRPFGLDEGGKPVGRTKGSIVRTTVQYMMDCATRRAAGAWDAGDAALAELISRLNAAIPDPNHHVTAEYLMNEGHSYSVEFDVFLSEICRELSGELRFHFQRGTRGTPASVVLLARPFSLSQVYRLLPRFAAKIVDTDFRVVSVSGNKAVIRWYSEKDLARLPQPLHRIFIEYSCQYIQGSLAAIPRLHSGLPLAVVEELHCQLHGDPYCEWAFTWATPERRAVPARPRQARAATADDGGPQDWLFAADIAPDDAEARPASVPLPDEELPPLPSCLEGPPFGAGPDGQPIRQITGGGLLGALRQMHDTVAWQKSQELPAGMAAEDRRAAIAEAQNEAWERLVGRLNAVMPDPRYRVSRDYLLDDGNYYSHEFNLYVNEFAREICGDPDFHFHRGLKSIPGALLALARPLSLRQIYALLPRLTAKVTEADFQVVSTTRSSAVIRWLPARQLAQLPPDLHLRYLNMACPAYQGVFGAVPKERAGLPVARIREHACAVHGDEYCEWEFTWERARPRVGPAIPAGVAISAALLAYTLARLPGWEWVAAVTALLPAAGGWLLWRANRSAEGEEEAQRLLLETRDTAEKQFDDFQQANAELQSSNMALKQRLSELTTLHEVGQALSVTLDPEELIDKSLRAVTAHLGFDRALILLLEERAGQSVLCRGRIIGGTPEMAALMARAEVPMDGPQAFLAEVMHSGQPRLVREASSETMDRGTRAYLKALGADAFLAVPLLTQGKPVGVLAVDNANTGRPISSAGQELLSTVGAQIASAIDSARLYQTLEQRVAERTAELAAATRQAEEARNVAEEANREHGALLDEMVRQNQYLAALHDTTVGLISRLDVNELLEALVTRAGQLLNAPHGFIFLAEPEGAELECKVGVGALSEAIGSRRKRGEGLAGQIWQTGQPLVVDDYRHWPGRVDRADRGDLGATMGVPLESAGQAVGAIGLAYDPGTGHSFGKEELELLSRFAQLASVALDNARLYSTVQETRRRLTDIIDFLPDATLVIDRDGRVIAWNRAIEEMTGIKAAEMLSKGDYEYALPFYGQRQPVLIDLVLMPGEELQDRYSSLERRGEILMSEVLVPALRGGPATLYATASALRDSRGEIQGAIEIIRDVSDRKRAEEDLRQAKAAAEAAAQAKSAFLATMSHEIRTPMNAVIGMTSLLLDTPLSAEQRDFAETIRSSGDALLTIINDILDFSKIEAGRIELERQPFDVRECVESALSLLASQAAEKGLELGCWIEPQVPAGILGDESRLRQVLLNLLANALKFTDEGEVVVTVTADDGRPTTEAPVDGRPWPVVLHFAVRDTGLGIPPDRMDRLFQSFSQVDNSTTRRYGGTGLGLAISQRLAELMGGRMWAESAGIPGQGSTFHFTIQAPLASVPRRAELQVEVPDLRGRRVLIVDDNATSRRILTLQTETWGMLAQATGSPAKALQWLRRGEAFDVAIVDRLMPELDGVMLAAEVRKLPGGQELPLVMISSLGKGEAEETEAFAAFLVKPVRASQLYNALLGILATRPEVQAEGPTPAASQFDAGMGVRQPLRILLAEDNVVNQKLALRLLERLGYRADVAANGLEAIHALERQPYDVVFMDVQMPEMDGLEATREIVHRWAAGERQGRPRPRIIAMTANALAEDREACLAAGMDDYLAKPIHVEELVAALSKATAISGS